MHGGKRIAHPVHQEFAESEARDGAGAGRAEAGQPQPCHRSVHDTCPRHQRFGERLIALLRFEQESKTNSDIERAERGLRWPE